MTTGSLDAPPRQAPSRVTIRDVAKAAGVSPSTVSRVMNGSPQIPQATRERILDLAQRLSYRPNAFARTLRGQRSGIIGVLTDDNEGVFANAMLRGLERVVADQGYSLFLGNTLGEAERERRHIRALMDRQVDGLILLDSVVARRSAPSGDIGQTPLVFLYCYTSALPVPCVIPDDRGGALLAVGHLISLGRRRIAYISGPRSGPLAWEASLLRQEGYLAALRQAGLVADPSLIEEGDWTEGSGFRAAQRLFALDQPPD
ncbi:MAG: LacI family transcriptional regulator, partial [Bifidobacteriaceae bacterium]|nr:LacI family transcriptional regulator [Bifidobacteriaceae bacterium]